MTIFYEKFLRWSKKGPLNSQLISSKNCMSKVTCNVGNFIELNERHLIALVSFPLRAGCDCAFTTMARVSLSVAQLSVLYVAPTETRPVDLKQTNTG